MSSWVSVCSSGARCVPPLQHQPTSPTSTSQLLNVQVPLIFKDIVDTLNVDLPVETTVWAVAGTLIVGCEPIIPYRSEHATDH